VRIALKPVTSSTAPAQASCARPAGASFIDTLSRASSDAVQDLKSVGSTSEEQPNGNSDSPEKEQTNDARSVVAPSEASGTTQTSAPAHAISYFFNSGEEERGSAGVLVEPSENASRSESSKPSQPLSKTAPVGHDENSSSIQGAADQDLSQRLNLTQPSVTPAEIADNSPASEQRICSHGSGEIATAPVNLQTPKSFKQPAEQADAETTLAAMAVELKNPLEASAGSQVLAAQVTSPLNLAAANTYTQGVSPSKSNDLSSFTSNSNPAKNSSAVPTANSVTTAFSGAIGTARSNGTQDSSSVQHANQNDAQTDQQAHGGIAQPALVASTPLGAITSQTIAFASHVASGASDTPHSTSGNFSEAQLRAQEPGNLPSDQLEHTSSEGSAAINTARLIQSMSESEMRLGMHSTEFGDISIRTSVATQQVQAQINVNHNELGNEISAHIPALQARLGNDFGLPVSIEVNQPGGSLNGGQGQASQQNHNLSSGHFSAGSATQAPETDPQAVPMELFAAGNPRLDIRV